MGLFGDLGNKIGNGMMAINPLKWADESPSTKLQRDQLMAQGTGASGFANTNEIGYQQLGREAGDQRAALGRLASGQDSVSAEQLRQGLQQQQAQQMSMAAAAPARDSAGAARTAAIQAGRAGSNMAGAQAIAGLQEQQQARRQLAEMILQQRQQALQAALGSRQTAVGAYGGYKPEGSTLDKWGGAIAGGLGILSGAGGKK